MEEIRLRDFRQAPQEDGGEAVVLVFFFIPGILQARMLEWVAIPFSRGPSQPRDRIQVSCIVDRRFTV